MEAIFADQLEEFDGNTPEGWSKHGKTWAITILPSAEAEEESDEEPELQMQLVWAHTPTYPDEPPSIRLRSVKGLADNELQEATEELQRHIQESLGEPMIYNLVTAAQEWLAARVAAGPAAAGIDPDAEEKRRREEEEAARTAARAHGTPVTAQAFLAWKATYDAERKKAAVAAAGGGVKGVDAREGRITGKQWFMQQLAAGKGESSGSEVGEDEGDFDEGLEEGDEDEDEEDFDYEEGDEDEDDDEDDMLEEYLATKGS